MSTQWFSNIMPNKITLSALILAVGCIPQLVESQTVDQKPTPSRQLRPLAPMDVSGKGLPVEGSDFQTNSSTPPAGGKTDFPDLSLEAPPTPPALTPESGINQNPTAGRAGQQSPSRFFDGAEAPPFANSPKQPPSTQPGKAISVEKSAPRIDTEVELPAYINLNQPAKMRIKLRNSGDSTAAIVKLTAMIPEHVRFTGSDPEPSKVEGQLYEFQLFEFEARQSREIIIDMVPIEKKPIDIGTEIVIENAQRFTVSVREPQIKIDLQGPTETKLGSNITHRVVLENVGDGIAENLSLEGVFPSHLRTDKTKNQVIPSLQPGQKLEVELYSLAVDSGQTELMINISGLGIENQTVRSDLKILRPELEIAVVGPQVNFLNRDGVYSLTLSNIGEMDATEVAIELKMPAGMKVTTINQQAELDQKTGALMWKFDRIAPKSEQTIKFITVATQPGNQECKFMVRSKETIDKAINLATNVVARPELNMSVQNQSGPVQVGGKAQLLVVVENTGSSKAEDINVQVELPDSLTANNQDGVDLLSLGNNLSFDAASLQPGQKREFRITAVASQPGEHLVRSILRTRGSERPIASEGSVFVYEVNQSRVSDALAPAVIR
jgi:hypothetical protein